MATHSRIMARSRSVLGALLAVACLGSGAGAQEAMHEGGEHHHHMTAEQLATLRGKIPLYQSLTDEQIGESMGRMTDTEEYLSPGTVRNGVGVLALGHGYGDKGNAQFKAAFADTAAKYPTAVGLGMAMMTSAHIQQAVSALEAAGAKTIIVVPSEIGKHSNLIRQWDYIFGRDDRSAYLDVPRVRTQAKIIMAGTPTGSPVVSAFLTDNLRTISRDPAREVGVVVAHGPTDEQENQEELADLGRHAAAIRKSLGLSEVFAVTLQDDAPTAVRQANVNRLRERIKAASAAGKRVLVTPLLLTGGGYVSMKIRKDLDGLTFEMADIGLTESPQFANWVAQTVAAASASSGKP